MSTRLYPAVVATGRTVSVARFAPVAVFGIAIAGIAALAFAVSNIMPAVAQSTEGNAECLAKYRFQPRLQEQMCGPEAAENAAEASAPQGAAPAESAAPTTGAEPAEMAAAVEDAASGEAGRPSAESVKIGDAVVVVQKVTGELEGSVYELVPKDKVHQNEVIETAVSSASEIVFEDQTKISLGPNTRLTLDEFVFDPDPQRGKFVLSTAKGVFRFVSGNMSKESYVIKTPTVTIGVRGTVFTSVTRADGTTAVVLQCPVCNYRWQPEKQRQCLANHGTEITVQSRSGEVVKLDQCNTATTVFTDGTATEPGPPPDWAAASLEELDDLVGEPEPDGPSGGDGNDTSTETGTNTTESVNDGGDGGGGNRSGQADGSNPGNSQSNNGGTGNPGRGNG